MEEKNTEQVQLSPVPGKKKRGKKRKTIRRIILALILVVILGGAAWLGINVHGIFSRHSPGDICHPGAGRKGR